MKKAYAVTQVPDNDTDRVAALERYQIVHTHRERAFDSICELACEMFSCPISHISFLDADTEFIKAGVGIGDIRQVGRSEGFCSVVILKGDFLLVPDALQDELFSTHPFVTDNLHIRFYAGAPIISPDGFIIGTLCLIDTVPRTFTAKEQQLLCKLAKVVMEQTELRQHNLSLLQQKDEFVAIASHEMRTPLTSLKAVIQILHKKAEGTPENRLLEQANRGVHKLSYLINDLFDASRLAERKFNLDKAAFHLPELIRDCAAFIEAGNKLQIKLTLKEDLQIVADREKIEQVLTNLLENAVKYATGLPKIEIGAERSADHVRIWVTDSGPGIAPEQLPLVFHKYFRAQNSTSQTGLGLGLYICAEIVKQHGGEIGVDSQPGQGATFWFTLPA